MQGIVIRQEHFKLQLVKLKDISVRKKRILQD